MRVLVTGVGGFLGGPLARALQARGHEVAGTWVDAEPCLPGVEPFEADLRDLPRLVRVVKDAAPDAVVHLAGLSHVGESWNRMPEYFQVNVVGSENVLAAAGNRRVVLASSAEVYGCVPAEEQPITEERPPAPRTPYALTKAAAERLALARGAIVARTFNLVGAGQSPNFALPAFATQVFSISRGEQDSVLRVGNLTPRRDFVHVEDGAEAFALLAERGEPGTIYNVASGRSPSIAEALERLMAIAGVQPRVEEDPARIRPIDLPLLCGDASRLRALGWAPQRTLDDALADLWAAVSASG